MDNVSLINRLCELQQQITSVISAVTQGAPDSVTRDRLDEVKVDLGEILGGLHEDASVQSISIKQEVHLAQFKSPVPEGFDTVLGWLAKHNPEALELMEDPIYDTRRDGWRLMHWAMAEDFPVHKVPAPKIMREEGIDQINAYPVEWLEKRLG